MPSPRSRVAWGYHGFAQPLVTDWTAADIRGWRGRLRWTQAQAAAALCYHLDAYKRLELGTRIIVPRIRRLCLLVERDHVRSLYTASGVAGPRQVFSTPDRVVGRIEALERDGSLHRSNGTPRLRYVSLFAGLESATAAMERIGADAIALAYSEIDPAANALLRYRWPDVPRVGDVCDFDWARLRGNVDLIVAGPPCQAFSVTGRRLGIADPRGNLILHALRAVRSIQPRYLLLENVPGLLTANNGDDFGVLVDTLAELGYSFAWRILDARDFRLPQRRRRLWLLAEHSRSARGPAEVLALTKSKSGHPSKDGTAWHRAPGRTRGGAQGVSARTDPDWSAATSWFEDECGCDDPDSASPEREAVEQAASRAYGADMRHGTLADHTSTLQVGPESGWSVNATPCVVQEHEEGWLARRLSPLECLRLQGLDDDWFEGVKVGGRPLTDTDRYRLAANAWPVPVVSAILERLLKYHDAVAPDRALAAA